MDKIHHLAIQVKDIKTAVTWYKEKFDANIIYEDESWAMLEFENLSLALVIPEQHPPHFAIESDDAEKFGKLTPHRDGTASIYLQDPFGNAIEIIKTIKAQ
jgi:extradiol dioxygenase family protein